MKLTINLLVSLALIFILSACNQVTGVPTEGVIPEESTSIPMKDENTVVVSPVFDGPNLANLTVGQTLVVQIPTIPEEGFEWILVKYDPTILVPESEGTYIEDTDPESAGGVVEFMFAVVGSGESVLNFDFQDEATGVSSNSYGLSVTVADASENITVITPDPTGPQKATLQIGEMLIIELPTIPEEGFEWMATNLDETILAQIGNAEYTADSTEDSAGGLARLQFEAVGVGETNLSLEYANISPETSDYVSQNSFGMLVIVVGEGPKTVVITPDPTGPQIATLNVGDFLVVEMPTIPEDGFEWSLPYLDTEILSQVGESEYIPDIALDSAGGVTLFQFKAVGPGETNLALEFAKMSEDVSDIVTKDAFGITVIVE